MEVAARERRGETLMPAGELSRGRGRGEGRGGSNGRTQMGLPLKFLEGSRQGRRKRPELGAFRLSGLDKSASAIILAGEIVSEINSSKLILPLSFRLYKTSARWLLGYRNNWRKFDCIALFEKHE